MKHRFNFEFTYIIYFTRYLLYSTELKIKLLQNEIKLKNDTTDQIHTYMIMEAF